MVKSHMGGVLSAAVGQTPNLESRGVTCLPSNNNHTSCVPRSKISESSNELNDLTLPTSFCTRPCVCLLRSSSSVKFALASRRSCAIMRFCSFSAKTITWWCTSSPTTTRRKRQIDKERSVGRSLWNDDLIERVPLSGIYVPSVGRSFRSVRKVNRYLVLGTLVCFSKMPNGFLSVAQIINMLNSDRWLHAHVTRIHERVYDCMSDQVLSISASPSSILAASLAAAFLLARPQGARACHPYRPSPGAPLGTQAAAL